MEIALVHKETEGSTSLAQPYAWPYKKQYLKHYHLGFLKVYITGKTQEKDEIRSRGPTVRSAKQQT
jgi:hypothetical protein